MRKEKLFHLLVLLGFTLLSMTISAQTDSRDVYGWLRYDDYNQDEYGICKFKTDAADDIQPVWPYDQARVACAGAFAEGFYYVYLYETDGYNATPYSFNRIDLSTGESTQVADYRGMPFLFQDMTYDYSTQTMYAIGYDESVYTTLLLKVNLTTGETTIAGKIGESKYVALACSYEGQLYAIDVDYGDLWSIDKFTGAATDIGYTGERVSEDLQSMEFDHETNTLYWAGYNFWGTIDTSTGAAEGISKLGNYAQVVGLYIPFKKTNPNVPAEISDLQITPGANGELSAELSWTNPSLTFGGNKLTNLTKIEIYRNEQLVHEITNPTIGEKSNWQDTGIQQNGSVVYRITAINNEGTSSTTAQSIFIGRDVPAAPSQLSLIVLDENRAKITWSTPQTGANGGWIDASALTYKITRLPDSIVVAETTTGNEYIDNSITKLNIYSYQIQAITPDGAGPTATTDRLVMGPALTVPYRCNFATDDQFALWNVIDANNDKYTWKRETTLAAAYYYYNEDGETGGDDWLVSSPIHLEKDKIYRLKFKLQSYDVGYPEKVAVHLGTGASVAEQTTLLGDYEIESNTFVEYKVILPEKLESGNYHISFHCHSEPYMFILYVTDVLLEEVSEGVLSGVVTNGQTPLEGVEVTIKDAETKCTTDEKGFYEFKELEAGNYTLTFNKTGYRYIEQSDIIVEMGDTAKINTTLEELPTYSVSGKIVNSKNEPISHAKVSITGYTDYSTESGSDGTFIFPQVYQSNLYALTIERYGLSNDTLTLNIENSNIVLDDIILKDKPLPPYSLQAEIQGEQVKLEWKEPMDTRLFRHDNGIHGGRLGTTGSTVKSVIALFDPNIRPRSGEKYLASFPARPGANNDFIISPELNFNRNFILKFYAKSYTEDYGKELMNVGYSVTGNDATDFIWLNGEKPIEVPMGNWTEYKYTIPAEAKYITINCVSNNIFVFMVDDIFIGVELPEGVDLNNMKENISFEVYLDGEKINTTQQSNYLFSGLNKGKHKAGVKAVFSSVTTPMTEIEFDVEEGSGIEENQLNGRTIHPNPAKETVTVSGEYDYLSIFDISGNEKSRYSYGETINVRNLPSGIYIVRIVSGSQTEVTKLVVTK